MNWFDVAIYQPILNALLYLQKVLPGHDMGLAIVLLTVAIKAIFYIPSLSAIRSSRQLQTLQPKLRELQKKYKDDKEGLAREQMKLYRESKVNPLSSCLPLLIQLPFLYALYRVFFTGLHVDSHGLLAADQLKHVYPALREYFTTTPLHTITLGGLDLAKTHNIVLAVLAAASQFWQTKMLAAPKEPKTAEAKDEAMTSAINKQATYIFPLFTLYIAYQFSAGLALYWLTSTAFQIGQQYIFLRRHPLKTSDDQTPTLPANGSTT